MALIYDTWVYVVVYGLINVIFIVPTILFYKRSRYHEFIQNRLPSFSLIISIVCIILENNFVLHASGFAEFIPCQVMFFTTYIVVPIPMLCQILRLCYLVSKYFVTTAKLEISRGHIGKSTVLSRMNLFEKTLVRGFVFVTRKRWKRVKAGHEETPSDANELAVSRTTKFTAISHSPATMTPHVPSETGGNDQLKHLHDFVERYGENCTSGMKLLVVLFILNGIILSLIAAYLTEFRIDMLAYHPHCDIVRRCMVFYALSVGYIVLMPGMYHVIRNVKDELWMKKEIMLTVSIFIPFLVANVALIAIDEEKYLEASYLCAAIVPFLVFLCTIFVPLILSYKTTAKIKDKHRIGMAAFEDLLNNKVFFQAFKEYLAQVFCLENALFWEDYQTFQRKVQSIQRGQVELQSILIRKQCRFLDQKYLDSGSQYELNIPSKYVKTVQASITKGSFSLTLFDDIAKEVVRMMYENNLAIFLSKRADSQSSNWQV